MRDYIISCCSTADLTEEHFKARDISYICFHFELNGKEYADDLGKSIPFDQFYAAMAAGADTKTSQVNAEEFKELHVYYTTRADNPLKKMQSLIVIACKILRVIYTILKTGKDYDPQKMLKDIKRSKAALAAKAA